MKNETKIKKTKKTEATAVITQSRARLGEYKGFTAVRIIRQLGSLGYKAKEAAEVLTKLGLKPNIHTVYVQILAGKRNEGPMAELTKKELAGLRVKPAKAPKAEKKGKGKKTKAAAAVEEAPAPSVETPEAIAA